jgi:hypothetical protein
MTVRRLREEMTEFEFYQWMYFYGGGAPGTVGTPNLPVPGPGRVSDDNALLAQFPELVEFKEG